MSKSPTPSINSWLEDELYQQYRYDQKTVDPDWKQVFEANGNTVTETNGSPIAAPARKAQETMAVPVVPVAAGDQLLPLRGPALRIAENMTASLSIPVATSQRAMPVKVIDENRRLIN
jgi:2-oxoglutarate dehydrogenase complex dehydrogenase (E1) component-like enzyme